MKIFFTFLSILIITLTVYISFNDLIPSSEKSLDKYDFSVENALNHLEVISKKPHYTGSQYHEEVKNYLVDELNLLGLKTEIQNQVVLSSWGVGTNAANIIGTIEGTNDGKSLVLLTHYDSRHHSSYGASDAGSGVATILEGLRAFLSNNKKPLNDIHVVFTDAEEIGLLGAQAFVKNHKLVDDIGLVLNFEARGSGGPSYMLIETNGKNGNLISEFKKASPQFPAANSLMYSVYKMLPNDTDLTVFREQADINGFNFAFIGDHFDYHTSLDTFDRLDRNTLLHQADYFMSMVNHFSKINLSELDSEKDYVYSNFPIIKFIYFSNSWIFPLLIFSIIFFLFIIYLGLAINKLSVQGILNGILALTISLFICLSFTIVLWKTISHFNPDYADMLHGFTYNGYYYITAFIFLNFFSLLAIYSPFFKNNSAIDLSIVPIGFWLILNVLISFYLKGAAFFLIPIYLALFTVILTYKLNFKSNNIILLWTIISLPLIYIFVPQLKLFPVGLGLNNLFITSFLLVLIFILLLPIFSNFTFKSHVKNLMLFTSIIFFVLAFINNDYDSENKKPNSILYYSDFDTKESHWLSYNNNIDAFTNQFFDEFNSDNSINFSSSSKYSTPFNQSSFADFVDIPTAEVQILKDTIIDSKRIIKLKIEPTRNINKIELTSDDSFVFDAISVQGVEYETNNSKIKVESGRFLSYYMALRDKQLIIDLNFSKDLLPNFNLIETSFDLMENDKFDLNPREDFMMPMPFVNTDAIVVSKKIAL